MGPLGMAWRSLRQRPLASALTALSVALGVALAASVMLLEAAARDSLSGTARGVEVLVGGTKGSRVDLVLSTLFHVGRAPGLLSRSYAEALARDGRVSYAIPVAAGDTYRGAPVVGTTGEFLSRMLRMGDLGGLGGKDAVVGAEAARHTGLRAGESFYPSHTGLEGDTTHAHEAFRVVAVAPPTGTAHDRAIFVGLDAFLHLRGHAGIGADDAITALLVGTKSGSPLVLEPFLREINDGRDAQAVRPMQVVAELLDLVGAARRVLGWVAALVVVAACLGVMVSLYVAMAERRREAALLRALGATRGHVLRAVLAESAILCAGGALVGLLLGHGGAALLAPLVEARAGVDLGPFGFQAGEGLLLLAMLGLGLVAGLLPAAAAYRTDVARGLDPVA